MASHDPSPAQSATTTPAAGPGPQRRRWLGPVLVLLTAAVLGNLLVLRFAAAERTLYSADHVAYWALSASLAEALAERPLEAVTAIADSVASRELNLLAATPIALVMTVLGTSRAVYLAAILDLYLLPALVVLWWVAGRLAEPEPELPLRTWAVATTALLLPVLWWPLSLGYLGAGGLVLGLAAIGLHLGQREGARPTLHLVATGGLLTLLFLFRRWYAFWSVAFGAMVAIEAAAALVTRRRAPWPALRPPLLIGASALATALVLAPGRVLDALTTDYGDRFAAYKVHPDLGAELLAWVGHFGVPTLALLAVAAALLLAAARSRPAAALLSLQGILTFALMRRVQDPSPQHWYLYLAVIMTLLAVGLEHGARRLAAGPRRWTVMGATLVVAGATTLGVFLAPGHALSGWLPGPRIAPQVRHDLDEVGRLLALLDRQLESAPGPIYVLGASPTLSSTSLAFANLSLGTDHRSPLAMVEAAHMDRRDGFPVNLLHARYVIVSDPVQCRRPADDQRVIEVPAHQILERRGIGTAFTPLAGPFDLGPGVKTLVFERRRPFRRDEVAALVSALRAAYPDRPEIWQPPLEP